MNYLILAAGKGTRLNPITLTAAKSLFRLDENTTVIQRMIRLIRCYDAGADITVVVGFMCDEIAAQLPPDVTIAYNPFYSVSNSVASLWFVRHKLLTGEPVAIFNADVVVDDRLVCEVVTKAVSRATVLIDTSIRNDGDYNARIIGDRVVVMSNELSSCDGEYAGITLLDPRSAQLLCAEVERFVGNERYNEWYETALVQMVFESNFELYYRDISEYQWTEIDCVDDLFLAKTIHGTVAQL